MIKTMRSLIPNSQNTFISLATAHHRATEAQRVKNLGVQSIYTIDKLKLIVGAVVASVGLVTLPLPTGSIVLVACGVTLIISAFPKHRHFNLSNTIKYTQIKLKNRRQNKSH